MRGTGDVYVSENVPAVVVNAAFEAACFPAGEMCQCFFLYVAGHEAVDQLFVQFSASISIVEAFSTTLRKKKKTKQNACSLQLLMDINFAILSEVYKFMMPMDFSKHLTIVLFHSG